MPEVVGGEGVEEPGDEASQSVGDKLMCQEVRGKSTKHERQQDQHVICGKRRHDRQ